MTILAFFKNKWSTCLQKYWRQRPPRITDDQAIRLFCSLHPIYLGEVDDLFIQTEPSNGVIWLWWGGLFAERYLSNDCPEFEEAKELLEKLLLDGDKEAQENLRINFFRAFTVHLSNEQSLDRIPGIFKKETEEACWYGWEMHQF